MSFLVFQSQGLRIFKGDTATVQNYIGLEGELSVNTETKAVYVHDGLTPGGTPLTTAEQAELLGMTLGQLANVELDEPSDGQVLVYDEEADVWKNELVAGAGGGAVDLDGLNDVDLVNPTDNQVLTYNQGLSKWENKEVPAAGIDGITSLDGKIGIGTSSPSQKLSVAGNAMLENDQGYLYLSDVGTGNSGIYLRGTGASNELRCHSTGTFTWETTGIERMRIDSSGKVGIGTSAPAKHLHVSGNTPIIRLTDATATNETDAATFLEFHQGSTDARMGYVGYGSGGSKHLYLYNQLSGGYLFLKTKGSGRTRIETDYGYADLGPTNSSYFHFRTEQPKFYFNKQCQAVSGFVTYSDERLKENVAVVENAVDALKKIRGVSFTWKKNADSEERPEGKRFGVLAQEVLQIDPEMCEQPYAVNDGDEKFYTFDYSNLTPYFIEAIKEQQATIESQQATIESQQVTINDLVSRLSALETKVG